MNFKAFLMLFSMTCSVHTFSEFFVVVIGAWASCRVTGVQGGNWRLFFSRLCCVGGVVGWAFACGGSGRAGVPGGPRWG